MPDIQISERLLQFLYFLPLFFISLTVHEYAHAAVAFRMGDLTAKKMGRLTLNPIKHIDLVGSIIVPLMAYASGYFIIGWAKPVPVNRSNFKNPRRDDIYVTAAGPLSNLILAALFFILFLVLKELGLDKNLSQLLWMAVYLNIFLALFNLLPIPPLDGSHLLYDFFPGNKTAKYLSLGVMGPLLLIIFIYSPLWDFFMDIVNFIMGFFHYLNEKI